MSSDYAPLFSPRPLGFASNELLTELWHAEISIMTQLLAKYPDLPNLFDAPEATVPQRTMCFALLAHRRLIENIDETFVGRYESSPSLDEVESNTLKRTRNLVASDAPAWVLEINEVVELLPSRIYIALPEPLRMGGYNPDDTKQMEDIGSAKKTLSTVEQIQGLAERVIDHQLQRLEGRWAASRPATNVVREIIVKERESNKRKGRRTRDKLRIARDKVIAEIDDVSPTITEFLKLMDERNVKPQPTWSGWPNSWREAYKDPRLRELIHKDKSRALARVRKQRGK